MLLLEWHWAVGCSYWNGSYWNGIGLLGAPIGMAPIGMALGYWVLLLEWHWAIGCSYWNGIHKRLPTPSAPSQTPITASPVLELPL